MNSQKVLISTSSFATHDNKPLELLKEAGLTVDVNPYGRKLHEQEIKDLVRDADFLVAGVEPLSRDVLESAKKLKVISRCGVGLDNVDLCATEKLGIKVFITPYGPILAVAELTLGLMIDLLRKITETNLDMRKARWQKKMGNLLLGKKVGIKGFGRIGTKVAELLKPFGCEIAYSDPFVEDGLLGLRRLSLDNLLRWADIVSVHVSITEKTTIIGRNEFQMMKKGSWFLNTSRGSVVDEAALYESLKKGHLSGAALDVFRDEPYSGQLTELDNVILTPHIGSYAKEARIHMEMQAVENLLEGIKAL